MLEQVTHRKGQVFVTVTTVASGTHQDCTQHCLGSAHCTFRNTAWETFTIRVFTRPLPPHKAFQITSCLCEELVFYGSVSSSVEHRDERVHIFWCQWYWKKKRDDCTFGSVISRGEENIWATLCSSGAECSELPARDYFTEVNIPFYPLSAEKRNHSTMCWDLFFIFL